MSKLKYISPPNEIPAGQKHILVVYGEEYAETRHPLGLTITVASTVSRPSFLTAIHTAKGIRCSSPTSSNRPSKGVVTRRLQPGCISSLQSVTKSIGLVRSASAPYSSAPHFVSSVTHRL